VLVGLLAVLTALVTTVPTPRLLAQEPEAYLREPEGPYRGRVVELLTEKPLEGALVLTIWERDEDGDRVVVAVREVLTDAAGAFVVAATEIEGSLPPRAFPPRTLVYKQGYVTLPRELGPRFGVPARRFAGEGAVVALKPVRDGEEWTEAFHIFYRSVGRLRGERLPEALRQSLRLSQEGIELFATELKRNPGYWGLEKSE
jgi:hypothetical protein